MDRRTMFVIFLLGVLVVFVMAYHDSLIPSTQAASTTATEATTQKTQQTHFTIPSTQAYSVLGTSTITPTFINRVLAAYHSPAAGKGQALYDYGVKYGIDPAFALAFFQHESTFGLKGEANASLSLGNLRCIPNFECRDNYAWFPTWEAGFEAWYKLIRLLYVDYWHLTTVEQIIPKYAPTADHNDEAAYIASVEHSIDMWREGQVFA